jgi:hypothetical protein
MQAIKDIHIAKTEKVRAERALKEKEVENNYSRSSAFMREEER